MSFRCRIYPSSNKQQRFPTKFTSALCQDHDLLAQPLCQEMMSAKDQGWDKKALVRINKNHILYIFSAAASSSSLRKVSRFIHLVYCKVKKFYVFNFLKILEKKNDYKYLEKINFDFCFSLKNGKYCKKK